MKAERRSFWSRLFGAGGAPAPPAPTPTAEPLFARRPLLPAVPPPNAVAVPPPRSAALLPTAIPATPVPQVPAAPAPAAPLPAAPLPVAPPPLAPLPGFVELPDLGAEAVTVERPGFWSGQTLRLPFAASAAPLPPRPLLEGTAPFAAEWIDHWHRRAEQPDRDVACYFVSDAVIANDGQIWLDGNRLVTARDLMPGYVYTLILGLPAGGERLLRPTALPLRVIDHPCVVMPGGQRVFGHFLIETLFYVLMVRRMLRGTGLHYRYLLSRSAAPWLVRILQEDLGIAEKDIEFYRPEAERVHLRQVIAHLGRCDGGAGLVARRAGGV
jgi:hypothetical protein